MTARTMSHADAASAYPMLTPDVGQYITVYAWTDEHGEATDLCMGSGVTADESETDAETAFARESSTDWDQPSSIDTYLIVADEED